VTLAPAVNRSRLLDRIQQLADIGREPGGGITRLAWSAKDRAAVELVAGWAKDAGGNVRVDEVGNLVAERAGTVSGLAPLVTGSHLDTVKSAGRLDGAYGVVAGIEVMACLRDAGLETRHPLKVVGFVNEEGTVAPAFTGSRAVAGSLRSDEFEATGPDGLTLAERLEAAGFQPSAARKAAWNHPIAATVELHIEQGPVLERSKTAIGIVTAITSQHRGSISIVGETNHAGTTPMALRRDALVAAARTILAVQNLATEGPADVATVGRIAALPGVPNVIAGSCELSFDVRAVDADKVAEAMALLRQHLADIEQDTGCTLTIEAQPPLPGARTDETLQEIIADVARTRGLVAQQLVSGAGHDCAKLVGMGPVGMIFVPSTGGISHSPAEATPDTALVDGAAVLVDTLWQADTAFDPGD
jgi:hydantoinase/carbamoylase family amidase